MRVAANQGTILMRRPLSSNAMAIELKKVTERTDEPPKLNGADCRGSRTFVCAILLGLCNNQKDHVYSTQV